MSMDRWTISLVLLNTFLTFSRENEINADIQSNNQENLQDDRTPGMMMLPQDCFEVCNDYECLYLCPQRSKGVKRCVTPLKSNRKNCCPNGQKEHPTATDNTKTPVKHVWHAREQFLEIKKELDDLAKRRQLLLKALQPLSLKQHYKEPLFKLGTKTSKPKTNTLICPVNNKHVTSPPNNCVSTKNQGSGADDKNGNHVTPKLPFYSEEELSREYSSGQTSGNNDIPEEALVSTITDLVQRNENVEVIREQVSAPNSVIDTGEKEEIREGFMDVSGGAGVVESGRVTYVTEIPKSYSNDYMDPGIDRSNIENFSYHPNPYSSSDTDQLHNYNYGQTITDGGETEKMGQNIFQPVPMKHYADSYGGNPMQIENNVLSQANRYDFLYTTPLIHPHSSSGINDPSKLDTVENITPVNDNYDEAFNIPLRELERVNQGSAVDRQSELNENILVESNEEFTTNDRKSFTSAENEKDIPQYQTNGSSLPKLANIEETTSVYTDDIPIKSYLVSEHNEHQSQTPNKKDKINVNFLLSNESDVRVEMSKLDKNENNSYVEKDEMTDSSVKMNNTIRNYGYQNNDTYLDVNEMSKNDRKTSRGDDKNSLLELVKLSSSAYDQKDNYTSRILQELISKYNITSILEGAGVNEPDHEPSNNSLDHETSKHHISQEKTTIDPNLTGQSSVTLKTTPNENEFYVDNTTYGQYSSNSIIGNANIVQSKLHLEKAGEESNYFLSTPEMNDELSSELGNGKTRYDHDTVNTYIERTSNILKPLTIKTVNDELAEPNSPLSEEDLKSDPLETIKDITKDNRSNTTIGDNLNGTSLDNGISNGNHKLIDTSHSQIPKSEMTTASASIFSVEKGSLKHSKDINDSQIDFHSNQLGKPIFHIMKNVTDKNPENMNINTPENQFYVESNIEEPMFENIAVNEMQNPHIVDQELLYDAGGLKLSSINSTNHYNIANVSMNEPIYKQFVNETDGNNPYDQSEKVLELIPSAPESPLPTIDDKSSETINHGIEEIHLKLEKSNGNSSSNIENEDIYNDLYESKNPDDVSTELNDSEPHTLEERKDSIVDKKTLSDIINTELNSIKQQNVIVKKREDEDMPYGDDPLCDCDYPTSMDERADIYPSSGGSIGRARPYSHPLHPIVIVVPVPYPICNCQNKTNHNTLNNNHVSPLDPYLPRENLEPFPDYSNNDHFLLEREGKAAQAPSYPPNLFIPYLPVGGVYTIVHPYHQITGQQDEKYLQSRIAMNEQDEKIDTTTERNPNGEGLENSNPGNMAELHQDFVSTPDPSDTQRFLRQDHNETEIREYVFIDGQYVKVLKDGENRKSAEVDKTEKTPTTVTAPPITDTSTPAAYIYTAQETIFSDNVEDRDTVDTEENDHWPVNHFYPGEFGSDQNPFYGFYYPRYVFTHRR